MTKDEAPKKILKKLGETGNFYARLEHLNVDFGGGVVKEAYRAVLPNGVFILPITDDGKIVLVHQYRVFGRGWTYEIPAGAMDKEDQESPEMCALRELEEETGYKAHEIEPLFDFEPHTTMPSQSHLFVARKLVKGEPKRDKEESEMEAVEVTPSQFWAMCLDGTIKQGQTIIACLVAKDKGILKVDMKEVKKGHPF
ncbi:NUDIX hydrolase [Candidatus Woesearchaeota archaeon]|nr:NUDIX hydrolase [Candidatus Woesearchaeota archaeon]